SAGGDQVAIGGAPAVPIVSVSFSGEQHAMSALVAAQRLRDIVARSLHPSIRERFHACVGVSSGTLVHTHVNGSGLDFQATGTVRMFASRLQEFAGPDQIFLAASTYLAVPVGLDVVPIGGVRTNGDGEREEAYCLRELASDRVANT